MSDSITFEELMVVQDNLQKFMGYPGTYTDEFARDRYSEQGAKEMLLAAIVECTEAMSEFSWKPWKPPGYKEVDMDKLTTELTDIIQFIANAAIYMGITDKMMSDALRKKWDVNFQRIKDGETTRE